MLLKLGSDSVYPYRLGEAFEAEWSDGDCYRTTSIDAVRAHESRIVLSRQRVAVVTDVLGRADLRMWIGYDDVDRLISYPDAHNLSGCA